MRSFWLANTTRRQRITATMHLAMLAVALAVAWQKDGPPADKAFWAILTYFIEIALSGIAEAITTALRHRRDA